MKVDPFFTKQLLPDCIKSKTRSFYPLFPAIRPGVFDFYYKGGRVFEYDGKNFSTHYKYAGLLQQPFSTKGLKTVSLNYIPDGFAGISFANSYIRIIENCSTFSRDEASIVAEIYSKYSYVYSNSDVVVLDIEIAFEKIDLNGGEVVADELNKKRKGIDRIDILLLNKKKKEIQFVEVKLHNNKELRAKSGSCPPIVNQIVRYEKQLAKNGSDIVAEYVKYINSVNDLFGLSLPSDISLDKRVKLWVFEFDDDQKKGSNHKMHYSNIESQYYKKIGLKLNSLWLGSFSSLKSKNLH